MKKFLLFLGMLLLIIVDHDVSAYIDCTPPSCPASYQFNGTTCSGSTCVNQCITYDCTMQWTEEQSDTSVGWTFIDSARARDASTPYQPSDSSKCYRFKYEGPSSSSTYINLIASTYPSFDCDTQGIGGFFQGSGITGEANPWFSGMGNYIDNVGNSEVRYMRIIVRADTEASVNSAYRIPISGSSSIYCVPENSTSCNTLGGTSACDRDCYGKQTEAFVLQGYFRDYGSANGSLYEQGTVCTGGSPPYAQSNRMEYAKYYVHSSPTVLSNQTTETSCFRTNEAPRAHNALVKPLSPNAGQDLECTFNYTDPESFAEQGSTFEWWKNSANQSINSRILAKGNLTINDQWYCKVTPSDGLLFGTQNQSTNTVTIATTVKNPTMTVGGVQIWNISGYYGWKEELLNFSSSLNKALEACTPDAEGFCNITMTFTSNATGVLDLTNFEVFYMQPLIYNFSAFNATGLTRIVEFQILNTNLSFSDFNWTLEPGDGAIINSTIATLLQDNEDVFVYVQHAYSTTGFYNVTATATNGLVTDSKTITIEVTVGGDT